MPGNRTPHLYCHGFACCVIDDHQALNGPTFGRAIEHEVHRPHVVGPGRSQQWLLLADQNRLAFAPPDLQLLRLIQPFHALVVRATSFLPQLQIDHSNVVALMPMRQGRDSHTDSLFFVDASGSGETPVAPRSLRFSAFEDSLD